MNLIDRRLLLGPEPYPVEELSDASKERRLLDTTFAPSEELEEFRDFIVQNQSEHKAWQTRFCIEQTLPEVRAALARGDERAKCVSDYREMCGELFLLEADAKLVAHLRPWAYEMVDAPDWEHAATRELWRRFCFELDKAWPSRKRFLQMHGDLRQESSD